MEQENRKSVMRRKEMLDQEVIEIQEKLKVIGETLSEFAQNLIGRPNNIVLVEISPAQTKHQENQIFFSKNRLKQAFNLELIDDYLMSLQHKDRELEVLVKELGD